MNNEYAEGADGMWQTRSRCMWKRQKWDLPGHAIKGDLDNIFFVFVQVIFWTECSPCILLLRFLRLYYCSSLSCGVSFGSTSWLRVILVDVWNDAL